MIKKLFLRLSAFIMNRTFLLNNKLINEQKKKDKTM